MNYERNSGDWPAELVPGLRREPSGGRVGVGVVQPHPPSQKEAPLVLIDVTGVLEDVDTQQEGEEKLETQTQ